MPSNTLSPSNGPRDRRPGDRALPADRRRRSRPVRRAGRHPEHAAAVGADGRADDGADHPATRRRALRQAVPDAAPWNAPVHRSASGRTGRCPRERRWTASRWRCRAAPPKAIPRAAGPRTRSCRSSARCQRVHRRRRLPGVRRELGPHHPGAPAPIWSGWTATPDHHRHTSSPESVFVQHISMANRYTGPATERRTHDRA